MKKGKEKERKGKEENEARNKTKPPFLQMLRHAYLFWIRYKFERHTGCTRDEPVVTLYLQGNMHVEHFMKTLHSNKSCTQTNLNKR